MKKELIVTVDKVWGEEIVLVNNGQYCGKLLMLDRNAESSYHCHKTKRETFTVLEGHVTLIVEGKQHLLAPFTRPKTIEPGEKHKVIGTTAAIILEISMPHSDDDVVRYSESKAGNKGDSDFDGYAYRQPEQSLAGTAARD